MVGQENTTIQKDGWLRKYHHPKGWLVKKYHHPKGWLVKKIPPSKRMVGQEGYGSLF